jgi:8-oxo-dGTP diphosphatase
MNSIIDLTKDDDIRKVAKPAAIRSGHEIFAKGEVAFGAFRPGELLEATIKMPGMATRKTRFRIESSKLAWKCTCTSDPKNFCKHLVATALAAQKEGRGDIYKAAGIIIQNRKLLFERSVGKPAFIAPGGRMEPGETPKQALVRELKEEVSIDVDEKDLEHLGLFTAEAANHPGQQVHMHVFTVKNWRGDIRPSAEVEEIRWLTSDSPGDIQVGSIFAHEIMPRLKAANLID